MMGIAGDSSSDPIGTKAVPATSDPSGVAVLQPGSEVEVAAALKRASEARQSIVIRGGGTKSDWGRPAGPIHAILDMRALNRVLAHEHGDMTATVEAGATLRDVNRTLARHGQWLPLDPPHADAATIGGILATNDSGPLRHRYGTPRDLVIGIRLATTDGVLAKAGGRVVKNVAGYDLGKLVTGSFGSLAAIVSATFKLSPLPAASKTLALAVSDDGALAHLVRTLMASQLEPMAFEVVSRRSTESRRPQDDAGVPGSAISQSNVLIRFASLPEVVDVQIRQAIAAARTLASSSAVVDGEREQALWREHGEQVWRGDAAIVRASWLPSNIAQVLAGLTSCVTSDAGDAARGGRSGDGVPAIELTGRAATGAGLIRIDGDAAAQARAIERLRTSSVVGNVVVVRGSPALKSKIDVWGSAGDRQPLFESLKRTFDPNHVLNAGRGPL
jgi:glycolate oxidase FAD binding subunit